MRAPVPSDYLSRLKTCENNIFILEIAAVLLAAEWAGRFVQKSRPRLLFLVDNNPALTCLVKGYADSVHARCIVADVWKALDSLGALPWFERVRSSLNLADAPSRGRGIFGKAVFPRACYP